MSEEKQRTIVVTVTFAALLGEELKRLRKLRLLTQEDVADAIGVHQGHFSRMERGTAVPNIDQVLRWCGALNVSMIEVLETIYTRWSAL